MNSAPLRIVQQRADRPCGRLRRMANQQFEPVCRHRRKTLVDQNDHFGVRTRDRRIDLRRGAPVDRGRRGIDAADRRRR